MRNKALYLALVLLALAAGMWVAQTRYAPHAPVAPVSALWQLDFPDVNGRKQALSQWRGQVLVLNFWASWCAPCREEMPDFIALRAQYRPKGAEFVGIAVDSQANVAQFLRQLPVDFPILIGGGAAHSLVRQLGNPSGALPFTIVLDRDGNIALSHQGRLPRATLETALRKIGA